MSAFLLACLAYAAVALPGSTLGLLWPSMRATFHVPLDALGLILAVGAAASTVSGAASGRLFARVQVGRVLSLGALLIAFALGIEALAPWLWVVVAGSAAFSLGMGAVDSALNVHAAHRFGARQVNWMHASFGLGATFGPLVVTAMLTHGDGWRMVLGAFATVTCAVGLVAASVGSRGERTVGTPLEAPCADRVDRLPTHAPWAAMLPSLAFTAVETGIESGAGIWGFVFLTAGRGLSPSAAGAAVSAYWATMVVGRTVLGPIAERVGAPRVLAAAVVGVAAGGAVMSVPGTGILAVVGMMLLGLAAAPIFPLLTLTTSHRVTAGGSAQTTRMVSYQVAASAVGSAALPSGIGVVLGATSPLALGPLLLLLGIGMWALYGIMWRAPQRANPSPRA